MESRGPGSYLETEVMTATPQKLQLMLIEAAIRFIHRARDHWRQEKIEEGSEALIRAQEVLTELLGGLNREGDYKLTTKIAAVYLFVFRSLVDAGRQHDESKLDDALKVLEVQRETWRQVCQRLGSGGQPAEGPVATAQAPNAAESPTPPLPNLSGDSGIAADTSGGFSLEA